MKKGVLLIPLILAGSVTLKAQSVGPATVNAAGNTTIIGGNEFEWSVGEMSLISTFSTPGIIITQGVLQPAPADVTATRDVSLTRHLQVFPNPASSIVFLEYNAESSGILSYDLMDITGRVLAKKTVKISRGTITEQINISELACATYMLKVSVSNENAGSESTSYKIEKLK